MLASALLVLVLGFTLFPIAWTAATSLKREQDIVTSEIQYLPRRPTLDNYITLLNRSGYLAMFRNSALTTVLTVLLCLTVGTLAAYSISRYRFRGRSAMLTFYLVVRMFPAVLLLLPLFIMLRTVGLLDTLFGLAATYTTFLLPVCLLDAEGLLRRGAAGAGGRRADRRLHALRRAAPGRAAARRGPAWRPPPCWSRWRPGTSSCSL